MARPDGVHGPSDLGGARPGANPEQVLLDEGMAGTVAAIGGALLGYAGESPVYVLVAGQMVQVSHAGRAALTDPLVLEMTGGTPLPVPLLVLAADPSLGLAQALVDAADGEDAAEQIAGLVEQCRKVLEEG